MMTLMVMVMVMMYTSPKELQDSKQGCSSLKEENAASKTTFGVNNVEAANKASYTILPTP
jgi:hypothetical protein